MTKRPKFEFLDGLRGICAVYVALYHSQLFTGHGVTTSQLVMPLKPLSFLLNFGHFSVAVFIVLSGFCLTIPVALNPDKKLRNGFKTYIARRSKRILPPYYIALILSVILVFAVPVMQVAQKTAWDSKIPVDWQAILSHFLMIHNLNPDWVLKINGPMWSVATEWQIYFLFPVLLWIWRKTNLIWSLAFALFIGVLPRLLVPSYNLAWMHPWYLGLFAIGMAAAITAFSEDVFWVKIRERINWKITFYGAGLLVAALLVFAKNTNPIISETLVGVLVSILIINYTLIEVSGERKPLPLKVLNSGIAVKLGVFSYSIYLIHSPLLALFNLLTLHVPININVRFLIMILLVVPAAIGISYIFHLIFERPFMLNKPTKKADDKLIEELEEVKG
ncbi:acyltransferase family protein [Pedobacter sp. HMF7647]|uniref:Acyltransferase family protein n=1 Tax=Hufsiella arboris TaxID=2695275 RepID=A0A7K1YCF8_9SPHI|nr:acyltransferase [Hufsiella arboris]MXV52120.1 acyltransferase family protein [Hufsiella arboris]